MKNKIKSEFECELLKLGVNLNYVTYESQWYDYYNIVKEYLRLSKTPITQKTEYRGYRIGAWLNQNKIKYKRGKLQKEKVICLKEIFDIELSRDDNWNNKYELIKEYISIGEKVDTRFVYKDVKLGNWYSNQFSLYNKGKLSADRVNKLKELGLLVSEKEKLWYEFIVILKEYLNNSNNKINSDTIYKNKSIGRKLCNTKKTFKQGKLPEERYQQLLSLGIDLAKEGSLM